MDKIEESGTNIFCSLKFRENIFRDIDVSFVKESIFIFIPSIYYLHIQSFVTNIRKYKEYFRDQLENSELIPRMARFDHR